MLWLGFGAAVIGFIAAVVYLSARAARRGRLPPTAADPEFTEKIRRDGEPALADLPDDVRHAMEYGGRYPLPGLRALSGHRGPGCPAFRYAQLGAAHRRAWCLASPDTSLQCWPCRGALHPEEGQEREAIPGIAQRPPQAHCPDYHLDSAARRICNSLHPTCTTCWLALARARGPSVVENRPAKPAMVESERPLRLASEPSLVADETAAEWDEAG